MTIGLQPMSNIPNLGHIMETPPTAIQSTVPKRKPMKTWKQAAIVSSAAFAIIGLILLVTELNAEFEEQEALRQIQNRMILVGRGGEFDYFEERRKYRELRKMGLR